MTSAALATLATAAAALGMGATPTLAATVSVKTGSVKDVSSSSATFRATVLLSLLGGTVNWQYGASTAYGTTTRTVTTSVLGVSQDVSLPITGLAADTEYHVRAVSLSGLTTSYGKDIVFKTGKPGTGPGSGSSGDGESGAQGGDDSGGSSSGSGSSPTTSTPPTTTTPTTTTPSSPTSGKTKSGDDDSSSTRSGDDAATKVDDDFSNAAADDGGATTLPGVATALVTPVLGQTLAVATVAGKVTATAPSGAVVDLSAARTVPTGTLIDTRAGTVELKSALDHHGKTQTARFWGGLFEVRQSAGHRGLTQLVLRGGDFSSCTATPARARAASKATKKKKPARSLWGSDDHGRFETRGRGSVATVRGTRWLTEDTCAGTRTTVVAGAVAVRDTRRRKTVVVTKAHTYLARVAAS